MLNGGGNYDVINLPQISISDRFWKHGVVRPVIQGSIEKVDIDVQNFDIDEVTSIKVIGGNGSGMTLEATIGKREK